MRTRSAFLNSSAPCHLNLCTQLDAPITRKTKFTLNNYLIIYLSLFENLPASGVTTSKLPL